MFNNYPSYYYTIHALDSLTYLLFAHLMYVRIDVTAVGR